MRASIASAGGRSFGTDESDPGRKYASDSFTHLPPSACVQTRGNSEASFKVGSTRSDQMVWFLTSLYTGQAA